MSGGPWDNLPDRPRGPRGRRPHLGWLIWLGGLAGLTAMVFALDRMFPGVRTGADNAQAVQLIGILALVSSGLLFAGRARINWRRALHFIALWLMAGGVLMLGYAYQEPILNAAMHLRSQVLPGEAVATGERELTISESGGGSFMVFGTVNGARIRFLVDTGASDIVLSPGDARRAGIDPDALKYDRPYATANGVGYGASVTLDRLEVGAITLRNVRASVQQAKMGTSLLGMTFLRPLKSYSVQDRKLVLRW